MIPVKHTKTSAQLVKLLIGLILAGLLGIFETLFSETLVNGKDLVIILRMFMSLYQKVYPNAGDYAAQQFSVWKAIQLVYYF